VGRAGTRQPVTCTSCHCWSSAPVSLHWTTLVVVRLVALVRVVDDQPVVRDQEVRLPDRRRVRAAPLAAAHRDLADPRPADTVVVAPVQLDRRSRAVRRRGDARQQHGPGRHAADRLRQDVEVRVGPVAPPAPRRRVRHRGDLRPRLPVVRAAEDRERLPLRGLVVVLEAGEEPPGVRLHGLGVGRAVRAVAVTRRREQHRWPERVRRSGHQEPSCDEQRHEHDRPQLLQDLH
jgi:hypothetical protein